MKKPAALLLILILLSGCFTRGKNKTVIQHVGPQTDGSILVPSNQLLRPAGMQVYLPGRPVDILLTPDEKYLVVKNRTSLDLISLQENKNVQSLPFLQAGATFTGLCLSRDGQRIFVTDTKGRISVAEIDGNMNLGWLKPIVLPAPSAGGSPFPGGIVSDETGDVLYVALSRNNSIAVVSLPDSTVREIPVGIAPCEIILASPFKAYVSNRGGRIPVEGEPVYNSSGSKVLVDSLTGIASDGTVSVVDLKNGRQTKMIGTGLHPCGMVLSPDKKKLYVACANSDIISVIDTESDEVVENISVHSRENLPFGSSPNDLVISPDGQYLYVANGAENAICVIETGSPSRIAGYIPTGWYPGSLVLDRDAKTLFVANVKGIGSRKQRKEKKGFNSHDHMGTISIIPVPDKRELDRLSATVLQNNSWQTSLKNQGSNDSKLKTVPVPEIPGQKSHFKHVVYIIKENRTYDQIIGDMPQGNGDTSLVEFGREVTPNHHLLAETFVLLDNFNCSGVLSADGHQWTDEAFVTDYLEKSFGGFIRSYPYDGYDALAYASSGFIWDNVLRHGLTFRNYGEFVHGIIEPADATFSAIYQDFINGTGQIRIRAKANLEQLTPYLCPTYIGFPNKVPDVYRAAEFIKELKEFEKNGNFPHFVIMLLPNDHTSGTRPGMPTPRASVADNDLALGQIVEAITASSFWKETIILVTEDDPQGGFDHVDGHRTVGLVISPWTKRGQVVSTYYSQINMVRTIENILGIPPMNRFDLSAEPMTGCFTDKPDYTPYHALKNNIPLDELNPPLTALSGKALYWAQQSLAQNIDDVDLIEEDVFNRIIWHAVKGYDKPYPEKAGKKPFSDLPEF